MFCLLERKTNFPEWGSTLEVHCIVSFHIVSHGITWYRIASHHIALHCIASYRIASYGFVSYRFISFMKKVFVPAVLKFFLKGLSCFLNDNNKAVIRNSELTVVTGVSI